jgi:hypothetical protein
LSKASEETLKESEKAAADLQLQLIDLKSGEETQANVLKKPDR